jgi:hypothetical protein
MKTSLSDPPRIAAVSPPDAAGVVGLTLIRTVQEWERGAKKPSGPARMLLRAIRADPEGLPKALAAASRYRGNPLTGGAGKGRAMNTENEQGRRVGVGETIDDMGRRFVATSGA